MKKHSENKISTHEKNVLLERYEKHCKAWQGQPSQVQQNHDAIAQVCTHLKIPFLIIRSISDKASDSANSSFEENIKISSKNATHFLLNMIINNHLSLKLKENIVSA